MQQRLLGQAKTPVSAMGYGAMSFSDFYGSTDDDKSYFYIRHLLTKKD